VRFQRAFHNFQPSWNDTAVLPVLAIVNSNYRDDPNGATSSRLSAHTTQTVAA
jgi:hypothetical protein